MGRRHRVAAERWLITPPDQSAAAHIRWRGELGTGRGE